MGFHARARVITTPDPCYYVRRVIDIGVIRGVEGIGTHHTIPPHGYTHRDRDGIPIHPIGVYRGYGDTMVHGVYMVGTIPWW